MLATSCYTRDELEHYLYGRTDDDLSSAIEFHLEACDRCGDTLSELDTGQDTLVRTLQIRHHGAPEPAAPWIEQLAHRSQAPLPENADTNELFAADQLGDYELVGVLGRGGMSVVFAARHQHLGREVAVKVLLPLSQHHAVSRERFAREMRAVGGLDHAAIVRATDAGEWNQTLYLVMELIDGVDLKSVARSEGPLRVSDACAIGREVAHGLAHAHDAGVVHRDIKPSNVMLDRQGNVKILDFGLARVQSPAGDVSLQTTVGQLLGTLDFMAPEQAGSGEVDARADIYALGATLFTLLVGTPPHGRSSEVPIVEYLNRLATREADAISRRRQQLPAGLVELMQDMLRRDPAARIASASDVAGRLESFAAGADLPGLATRSAERALESQHSDIASIKESLAEWWPSAAAEPSREPPDRDSTKSRSSRLVWVSLASAMVSLCGITLLTIILTLKLQQGEIRIESELEKMTVEIVDEQDRVESIAVDQGPVVTQVRAGRYRIRLDSPSDGIVVMPQEVVVKRGQTVIAQVSRTTQAVAERDPLVAMEAQLQLAETSSELEEAKQAPDDNAELIRTLEAKAARLRALSRQIPQEPVFEGRTLADWVAQMRFEQEPDARRTAAESVLQLADTRPPPERMELILQACPVLLGEGSIDRRLSGQLSLSRPSGQLRSIVTAIKDIGPGTASQPLAAALESDDQRRREDALLLCAALRPEIRRGDWPAVISALERRSTNSSGDELALLQLTRAACLASEADAAQLLLEIDLAKATEGTMFGLFYVTDERNLPISRGRQLDWLATCIVRLDHPVDVDHFWHDTNARLGPFRATNWDRIGQQQAEINQVVGPLLAALEQCMTDVAADQRNQQRQKEAALKSTILTRMIEQADLTGAVREKAVSLLRRRLTQLLWLRAHLASVPDDESDTPAGVAVALLLLTGEIPRGIKQPSDLESGYLAEQLERIRQEAERSPMTFFRRGRGGGRGGQSDFFTLFPRGPYYEVHMGNWYPYELLPIVYRASMRGGGNSLLVDPRLMLDYYAALDTDEDRSPSSSLAELLSRLGNATITRSLNRHPKFRDAMTGWMEASTNRRAVELLFEYWSSRRDPDDALERLLTWLDSGNVAQTRVAIDSLHGRDVEQFLGSWAPRIATAIDRLAEADQLNASDIQYLQRLGKQAPRAPEHALVYLTNWLTHTAFRTSEQLLRGRRSPLNSVVSILANSPSTAQQAQPLVERALVDQRRTINSQDRMQLEILLQSIGKGPK